MFAFSAVSFGDKPAAALLEIAVKKVAELNSNIDPVASNRIINDRYVDEFVSSGSLVEVSRFNGKGYEDFQCNGTFQTIMSFRLKAIVVSGEANPDKVNKIGGKVLGVGWKPCPDTLYINLNVSLTTSYPITPHSAACTYIRS